jgi:uncharacterized protein YprB with RNaseH-like and TPR domain
MRLDQRLRLLHGAPPEPPRAAGGGDLSERLRRLAPASRHPPPQRAPDELALAERLGAERLTPGLLRAERRFPLAGHHGRVPLADCPRSLRALTDGTKPDVSDWLFLDTETSGLAGGTGTWAFLTGLVRIEGAHLLLRQYLLTRLDTEPAYLEALETDLAAARVLVTYNGKSFDGPLLTTRFRLAGMRFPLVDKPHVDLLHLVRLAFARVWPDCRLATAETRLIGFRRRGDLPGGEAPRAWLAWLREGETTPLVGVLEHNRWDLLSLPALAPPLEASLRDPSSTGADIRSVAEYHRRRGEEAFAVRLLSSGRRQLSAAGLLDLARLYRRRGDWRSAREIWESLAAQGETEATEALAKYLEHRLGDHSLALTLARRLPPSPERDRRCQRLARRLADQSSAAL